MQIDTKASSSNGVEVPEEQLPSYEPSNMSTNGDTEAGPRDRKADYALSLQKACTNALQRVKNNEIIANTSWAAPLAAAPSAISTMAILLKAADKEAAAGLEIESQDVLEAGKPVGRLP